MRPRPERDRAARGLVPALVAVALTLGGCGSSEKDEVEEVLRTSVQGLVEQDGEKYCEVLSSEAKRDAEARARGQSCVEIYRQVGRNPAFKALLSNVEDPKVEDVKIDGEQGDGEDRQRQRREGRPDRAPQGRRTMEAGGHRPHVVQVTGRRLLAAVAAVAAVVAPAFVLPFEGFLLFTVSLLVLMVGVVPVAVLVRLVLLLLVGAQALLDQALEVHRPSLSVGRPLDCP